MEAVAPDQVYAPGETPAADILDDLPPMFRNLLGHMDIGGVVAQLSRQSGVDDVSDRLATLADEVRAMRETLDGLVQVVTKVLTLPKVAKAIRNAGG